MQYIVQTTTAIDLALQEISFYQVIMSRILDVLKIKHGY